MKIVKPGFEILTEFTGHELEHLEKVGRTCYKSEDKISEGSAEKFVRMLVGRGHEAILEHGVITVRFICDRGISHQIVRHRIASFAQESTRYCSYDKGKYGGEITVIKPCFLEEGTPNYDRWYLACRNAEEQYMKMLRHGMTAEEARSVLPNSLKTEVIMTANYREWRHFFAMRCSKAAHPQIREIAIPLQKEFAKHIPVLFEDSDE